jgi:UDP-glucose 4-epimerase
MNEAVEIIFDYMDWDSEEINYMMDKLEGVRHRAADAR